MAYKKSRKSRTYRKTSRKSRKVSRKASRKSRKSPRRKSRKSSSKTVRHYHYYRRSPAKKRSSSLSNLYRQMAHYNNFKESCTRHSDEGSCGGNPNCMWTPDQRCMRRQGGTYEGPRMPSSM